MDPVIIGGSGTLFLGEDKELRLEVLDELTGVPVDITGKNIKFDVRASPEAEEVIFAATATVDGAYSATPGSNAQRAVISLADTDLTVEKFGATGGTFYHSWKDLTPGGERILAYGTFVIERATQVD